MILTFTIGHGEMSKVNVIVYNLPEWVDSNLLSFNENLEVIRYNVAGDDVGWQFVHDELSETADLSKTVYVWSTNLLKFVVHKLT